jgi:hypothetical protein
MAGKCVDVGDMMRCSCRDCANRYYNHIDLVECHLYMNGIDCTYTRWVFHCDEVSCRVNVSCNLDTDTNARIEEIDEVGELLGDFHMETFMDVNKESYTTWGAAIDDHE